MKVKTSITLSSEVLEAVDRLGNGYRSRSAFIETAVEQFVTRLVREQTEKRDLEIINRKADALNQEAEDVLDYQAPM